MEFYRTGSAWFADGLWIFDHRKIIFQLNVPKISVAPCNNWNASHVNTSMIGQTIVLLNKKNNKISIVNENNYRSFLISSSKYNIHPLSTSTWESRNNKVSPVAIFAAEKKKNCIEKESICPWKEFTSNSWTNQT